MEELRQMMELAHRKIIALESVLQELEDDNSADFCEDCHLSFFERIHSLRQSHLIPTPELDKFLYEEKYLQIEKSPKTFLKTDQSTNRESTDERENRSANGAAQFQLAMEANSKYREEEQKTSKRRPTLLPHTGLMQAMKAVQKSRKQEAQRTGGMTRGSPTNPPGRGTAGDDRKQASLEAELKGFLRVVRRGGFCRLETVGGRKVNVLDGLELHENVLSEAQQRALGEAVLQWQEQGRRGGLLERTYKEPRKWSKGKGRATIQFGCCNDYVLDKDRRSPGILPQSGVDPLPPLLKSTIRQLVRYRVVPPSCVPDSCLVSICEPEDCIPPRTDHHDFLRPFCTLSLLSDAPVVFGSSLEGVGPEEIPGAHKMLLPKGSVLVIQGNSADVAKHGIPSVGRKLISITFWKMDPRKMPAGYRPDAELANIIPLPPHESNGSTAVVSASVQLSPNALDFVPQGLSPEFSVGSGGNLNGSSCENKVEG